MDRCSDTRYQELLAAYELGMLEDAERRELEMHLLECDACFARAEKFRNAAHLFRQSPRVRDAVQHAAQEDNAVRQDKPRRSVTRLLATYAVAAAALLVLLLRPWHVEIQPWDHAFATGNRVAVFTFANLTGNPDHDLTGRVLANLLITDLAQSSELQLVSSKRLHDLTGDLSDDTLSPDNLGDIAARARADWIISGSVLADDPGMVLTVEVSDATTRAVVAAETITGLPDESVFSLVDRMTARIARTLGPLDGAWDNQVADVTTHSREAYRNYIAGLDNYRKLYRAESRPYFLRAVELDSTFAMAYYYLVYLGHREYIEPMTRFAANVEPSEQHRIRALVLTLDRDRPAAIRELQALLQEYPDDTEVLHLIALHFSRLQQPDSAVAYWQAALQIDPTYKIALNQLAYFYASSDRYDDALIAINKYIEAAPDEANPYDTRAEIYSWYGHLEEAAASYRQALAIKPDFFSSLGYLGYMNLFAGRYETADSCFAILTDLESDVLRPAGRLYRSYTSLHQGKFRKALMTIEAAIDTNSSELAIGRLRPVDMVYIHRQQAYALFEMGLTDSAVAALDMATGFCVETARVCFRHLAIQILAEGDQIERASERLDELRQRLGADTAISAGYQYAFGCVALTLDNNSEAVNHFEAAWSLNPEFIESYMLGRAYLAARRLSQAVTQLERTARIYTSPRASRAGWSAKTHYYLGLAYEESRWYDRAAEQYEQFLSIFAEADEGTPEVEEARKRLARIRSRS